MKKSTLFPIWGGVILGLASCQKVQNTLPSMANTAEKVDAKKVELSAYEGLSSKSKAERYDFFESVRADLAAKTKTTTNDYEFEDAFLALEGLVNNDFFTNWDDFDGDVVYETIFDLPYSLNGNNRTVSLLHFADTYMDIYNDVNGHYNPANDEMFLMLDLSIEELDDSLEIATLKAKTYIGSYPLYPPNTVWLTPDGALPAVKGGYVGPCNPNGTATTDAADVLRVYANQTAPWKALNCANGVYTVPVSSMTTYKSSQNDYYFRYDANNNPTWYQIIAHYWHNDVNECLGGTDPNDWYALYNQMDFLVNYGQVRANNWLHNSNPTLDASFWMTDYHSHYNYGLYNTSDISDLYYHGGLFHYAIIGCN